MDTEEKLNHTLYLSDKKPVCEEPERVGHDFVINAFEYGVKSCTVCMQLIFAENRRALERDLAEARWRDHMQLKGYNHSVMYLPNEDFSSSPMKGVMLGVLIGSLIWFTIGLVVWISVTQR